MPPEKDSTEYWFLRRRLEEIGLMFHAVWTIYITFYTVFLTFTGVAFG